MTDSFHIFTRYWFCRRRRKKKEAGRGGRERRQSMSKILGAEKGRDRRKERRKSGRKYEGMTDGDGRERSVKDNNMERIARRKD